MRILDVERSAFYRQSDCDRVIGISASLTNQTGYLFIGIHDRSKRIWWVLYLLSVHESWHQAVYPFFCEGRYRSKNGCDEEFRDRGRRVHLDNRRIFASGMLPEQNARIPVINRYSTGIYSLRRRRFSWRTVDLGRVS